MGNPCPQCGQRMILELATSRIKCPHCGYVRPDEISGLEKKEETVKAQHHAEAIHFAFGGEIGAGAFAAFESGQDALAKGDRVAALECFQRSADYQPEFIDAHLWIAKTTDDVQLKRDELGIVLNDMPGHLEAMRMIMVLNGKLTPEQAAQTYHFNDQHVQQSASPVTAKTSALVCPNCGGDLTQNGNKIECRFCGYSALQAKPLHTDDSQSLLMALLERKAQPTRWNVGQRVVKCQQCGAEQTLTAEKMSDRCRFCGSNRVVLSDALGSFEQPGELIPFSVDEALARESINSQLNGLGQRIMNVFNPNKVKSEAIQGVYLPFWIFDVDIEVTRVKSRAFTEIDRANMIEMVNGIAVSGVKSPPLSLTTQLSPYNFAAAVYYEPKWLAKYPAQMYSVDFDAASLDAQTIASRMMKRKYDRTVEEAFEIKNDHNEKLVVTVFSNIQRMTFRLVLLPVWIATLIEDDGDIRLAVVNGQTGKTALGKASKSKN
ncbi:MAG: hypothetical protein ABI947_01600 [Chloroflexota bacterium]